MLGMTRIVAITFIVGHTILTGSYWFLSYDPAGTAMLGAFGLAMILMGWMLIPTLNDVGPTAPVDPDWAEHRD
jgi:hypothetical protein